MKTLIIYHTKYGTTQQYAQWLCEDLKDADLFSMKERSQINLNHYQQIVIGSPVYMGRISLSSFLVGQWMKLKAKKVYLFAVGNMPADSSESIQSFNILPEEIREGLQMYLKLPGKVDFSRLNFFDRLILKRMGAKNEDNTDRKLLKPLIGSLFK